MPSFAGFEQYVLIIVFCTAVPSLLIGAAAGYALRGRRGESKG